MTNLHFCGFCGEVRTEMTLWYGRVLCKDCWRKIIKNDQKQDLR